MFGVNRLRLMQNDFKTLFGQKARQFQIDTATSVLNGIPTVLRAPTGYGKTAAAQFPFLFARQRNLEFPRQMLYSLPLRVLANSLHKDAREKATLCGLLPENVRIQTGEFQQDTLFLGDLTFTTYDQLLSGFLHIPLSLPFRLANVLAGASASSYLAFDEVHLMEMGRALGTTAAMLHWLRGVTPSLLMTATLTDAVLEWLHSELQANIVQLPPPEIKALPRARCWHRQNRPLDAAHILEMHNGKRTIVVANTVDGAQRIFAELSQAKPPDTKIILLHSRFFRAHRNQKEEQLLQLFGERAQGSAILVATQVIEVGLNISCDNLHTDVAPANSLIQRAGRCARFPNETGNVWVYDIETVLPYTSELCGATDVADCALWKFTSNDEPQPVGYQQELEWVEVVHGERDKAELISVRQRKTRIFEVIAKGEKSAYGELIRKSDDTLTAIISPEPEATRGPWDLEGLSIRPGTLTKYFDATDSGDTLIDENTSRWFAKKPRQEEPEEDAKRSERREPPKYEWLTITKSSEFYVAPLIALNPRYVSYSFELGLRFGPDQMGESGLSPCVVRRERERFSYVRETYFQHIDQVWKACARHFVSTDRLTWAARRLEERCGLKAGDFQTLLRLVVAGHDVGKLSEEWQNAVQSYQHERWKEPLPNTDFLAHTLYDPAKPQDRAVEKKFSRPPHAGESAVLTQNAWEALGFDEFTAYATFSAIARHHSPFLGSVSAQTLALGAPKEIKNAALACGVTNWPAQAVSLNCRKNHKLATSDWLLKPDDDPNAYLLYLLLVRALRISDQFSFDEA